MISSLRDRTLRLGLLHPRGQTHRLPSKGQRHFPPSTTPCTMAVLKLETKVRDPAASQTCRGPFSNAGPACNAQTSTGFYRTSSQVNSRLAHTQETSAPCLQQSQLTHQQRRPSATYPLQRLHFASHRSAHHAHLQPARQLRLQRCHKCLQTSIASSAISRSRLGDLRRGRQDPR